MVRGLGTSRDTDARIGCSAPTYLEGERAMSMRLSRWATGLLVVAVMVLISGRCWAVFHGLGPSKDEWGLKYDVAVSDAGNDKLTVLFTLADEGRLKPIYSIHLVAFSKQTDSQGGRSYDAKLPLELKMTQDGRRVGQVQIRKEFADRAMFRILTLTVDGKRQTAGAAYYDIPIVKFMSKAPASASPAVASPLAPPSTSKVTR